jgi:dCMP deaminase
MTRKEKDEYFIDIATLVAKRSTCPRRQVGCVIIDSNKHILATGYNGVPKNFDHCIDTPCGGHFEKSGSGLDKCHAIHAEQNALLQCSDIMTIKTIYVTTFPCIHCAKMILNTSCDDIIYKDDYPNNDNVKTLLANSKIRCRQWEIK